MDSEGLFTEGFDDKLMIKVGDGDMWRGVLQIFHEEGANR
jgi:hypothetical protein